MALEKGAKEIITGSFSNVSAVCEHIMDMKRNVILGCAAWKDKVNMEDTLFAGAIIANVRKNFEINCDSSHMAEAMYDKGKKTFLPLSKRTMPRIIIA
jgi:2-phosphosulfolactate phosphatase